MPPTIPFRLGDVLLKNVAPGAVAGGSLPAGRWCVNPRTTVPFVGIVAGTAGRRSLTWGEVVEIPEGATGTVCNDSFHTGDVVLSAIGTGAGHVAQRPATLTLAANIAQVTFTKPGNGFGTIATRRTQAIDTRLARRCYLAQDNPVQTSDGVPEENYVVFPHYVVYDGSQRAQPYGNTSQAGKSTATGGDGGRVIRFRVAQGFIQQIPLGIASAVHEQDAPAINSGLDTMPMALLDALYVVEGLDTGDAAYVPFLSNVYFVLEY